MKTVLFTILKELGIIHLASGALTHTQTHTAVNGSPLEVLALSRADGGSSVHTHALYNNCGTGHWLQSPSDFFLRLATFQKMAEYMPLDQTFFL